MTLSTNESRKLSWFGQSSAGPSAGRFERPETSSRSQGHTATRASLRMTLKKSNRSALGRASSATTGSGALVSASRTSQILRESPAKSLPESFSPAPAKSLRESFTQATASPAVITSSHAMPVAAGVRPIRSSMSANSAARPSESNPRSSSRFVSASISSVAPPPGRWAAIAWTTSLASSESGSAVRGRSTRCSPGTAASNALSTSPSWPRGSASKVTATSGNARGGTCCTARVSNSNRSSSRTAESPLARRVARRGTTTSRHRRAAGSQATHASSSTNGDRAKCASTASRPSESGAPGDGVATTVHLTGGATVMRKSSASAAIAPKGAQLFASTTSRNTASARSRRPLYRCQLPTP